MLILSLNLSKTGRNVNIYILLARSRKRFFLHSREQIKYQIFKQAVRYMLNVDRRGRAREDVVWLPVDSTNSGIQIVAAARRREKNHEQIWAKNKVSVDRS